MYRVQNDPRCVQSCQIVYHALMGLLDNGQELEDISVSEICRVSTVSRSTFYRHFDKPIDILIWKSDRKMSQSFDRSQIMRDWRKFTFSFFSYWNCERSFLAQFRKTGRMDLLLASLEKLVSAISPDIFAGTHLGPTQQAYLIRIWSVIVWSILQTWAFRGFKESIDELTDVAMHNLPDIHKVDCVPLVGNSMPISRGEIRFVSKSVDSEAYFSRGAEEITWEDLPKELVENCRSCDHSENCGPIPMKISRI